MAMGVPWRVCLLACFLLIGAARSEPPALQKLDAGGLAVNGSHAPPRAARALSTPLIVDDGRLVACSGKDLLAFERDGSIAWTVPLGHTCNHSIRLVYLVAEDKVIKVTPRDRYTAKPASSEVFFSYNATPGRSEEIIGLAVSGSYSSLFLTIRNRGLFVLSLQGVLQWSLGPVLDWYGYRLGCKGNISGCYFDSAPVLDHYGGALYILNTEGQLYSFNIQSRALRWIQDLSSLDKVMTIAPGNSGSLCIVFPLKSIVVGLDVSTGNISWKQSIGPLSNEKTLPIVDSNGWMSIGSLDGILYSVSPDGDMRKLLEKTAHDSVIHVDPVLDCSGFSMYVAKIIVEGKLIRTTGDYTTVSVMKPSHILVTLLAPATGTIYWTGDYPGTLSNVLSSRDLNDFVVDETVLLTLICAANSPGLTSTTPSEMQRSLHIKKRALGKTISELEQKAAEDTTSNEILGELGEMLKAKEGVERKLNASYSLGSDKLGLKQGSSILPLYSEKYKSHSFHSRQKENITVFNILSDTSTSEDSTASYSDDGESCSSNSSTDMDLDVTFKSAEEAGPSNTTNDTGRVEEECPSDVRSPSRVFANPLFIKDHYSKELECVVKEGRTDGISEGLHSHHDNFTE
nr:unnamed protein product [Digitaria exilis]